MIYKSDMYPQIPCGLFFLLQNAHHKNENDKRSEWNEIHHVVHIF